MRVTDSVSTFVSYGFKVERSVKTTPNHTRDDPHGRYTTDTITLSLGDHVSVQIPHDVAELLGHYLIGLGPKVGI